MRVRKNRKHVRLFQHTPRSTTLALLGLPILTEHIQHVLELGPGIFYSGVQAGKSVPPSLAV